MCLVCQCDLAHLLDHCRDLMETEAGKPRARNIRILLNNSTKCLARAVEYLHENRLRHYDIKPQNVLYRNIILEKTTKDLSSTHVYLSDFGLSQSYDESERSTTTGFVRSLTRRYAAPEVVLSELRGRSTDMSQLGCVFYEIIRTALCPGNPLDIDMDSTSLLEIHETLYKLRGHIGVS
jgi:serine/threonine protein kinase